MATPVAGEELTSNSEKNECQEGQQTQWKWSEDLDRTPPEEGQAGQDGTLVIRAALAAGVSRSGGSEH